MQQYQEPEEQCLYRIIETFGLEKTCKIMKSNSDLEVQRYQVLHYTVSLCTTSTHLLNNPRDGRFPVQHLLYPNHSLHEKALPDP